jgi:hypothetical protein
MARVTQSPELMFVVAGALALLAGCQEPVPGQPTYTTDIKPLFEAHCVRCHSADGVDGSTGKDPRAINGYATDQPVSHLGSFADVGDCDPDAGFDAQPPCVRGAQYEALVGPMSLYIHTTLSVRMPLAPSEPLTSWELSLVDKWIANGAPE